MKTLEILFTRAVTFRKVVNVSDKLADRLLKLNGETDLLQKNGTWGGEDEDTEELPADAYKADDVSSDDFTMLAEDLTSIHDVYDESNEITSISVEPFTKKK